MTEECDHIQKIVEWEYFLEDGDVKSKIKTWGCTKCDILSENELYDMNEIHLVKIDHTKCGGPDKCFGCKAAGLQLNTGDANSQKGMSNKKWDGELNAYRQARSEGIQPAGTSMAAITEARRASEAMGKAYDADTMPATTAITKESASSLKEMGVV